jgi:hypothetical protein
MEDKDEVLLTSDSCDHRGVLPAPVQGGHLLSSPNTVCLVGRDYLLSARPDKPFLNVWQVKRKEQSPLRLFTPGPVSAVSPSGPYLVAAVLEHINIWRVGTGSSARFCDHYQHCTTSQSPYCSLLVTTVT